MPLPHPTGTMLPMFASVLLGSCASGAGSGARPSAVAATPVTAVSTSPATLLPAIAASLASYEPVDRVETFSGGLEVTAFNPRAMAAVERAGFVIDAPGGDNPHVRVTFATDRPAIEAFSKKYGDPFNPQRDFAAVMTCSHADASCPLVLGASLRVSVPYEDPKASDGTPDETATYDARSKQIATEMLSFFSGVKSDPGPIAAR